MKIGFNLHPTKRLDTHKIEGGHRILMSCGGGMGGSKWYEYVTDMDMDGEFIDVICLNGQSKLLSKEHAVSITPVDFYGQTVDISDWCDGGIRKSDNPVYTEWFDVKKGEEVEYVYDEGDNGGIDRNRREPCYSKKLPNYHENKKVLSKVSP